MEDAFACWLPFLWDLKYAYISQWKQDGKFGSVDLIYRHRYNRFQNDCAVETIVFGMSVVEAICCSY